MLGDNKEKRMVPIIAWILGVPLSLILLWMIFF